MTTENQDNGEEYKLTKPENIYAEEPKEEVVENSIEKGIDSEVEKMELNQKNFEANVNSLGGEEHIRSKWDAMDIVAKEKITKNIEKYSYQKESAIAEQGFALSFFNPIETYKIHRNDEKGRPDINRVIAGTGTLMTFLLSPIFAVALGAGPTIERIKNSRKLKKEQQRLKDLEWQKK